MKTQTRITSGGALVDGAGRVLLGLRGYARTYYPGVWDMFGGHVEAGESPEQALVRELQEEIGVRAVAFELVATVDEPRPEKYGSGRHYAYLVREWEGTPTNVATDEHEEIRWFRVEDLRALDLAVEEYLTLFQAHV